MDIVAVVGGVALLCIAFLGVDYGLKEFRRLLGLTRQDPLPRNPSPLVLIYFWAFQWLTGVAITLIAVPLGDRLGLERATHDNPFGLVALLYSLAGLFVFGIVLMILLGKLDGDGRPQST